VFHDQSIPLESAITKGIIHPLETFPCPYEHSSRSGVIRIVFPEFTCVCPKTGYPDFGAFYLFYLPNQLCIELKSWKLYLNSFRMVGTFHEAVTAHIYKEISTVLAPQWLLLAGDFYPRGNVDTTIVFESDSHRPAGADLLLQPFFPHCNSKGE